MLSSTSEGIRRRDAVHDVLATHREKQMLRARRAFLAKLLADGLATADDVHSAFTFESGVSPVFLGAVPKPFVAAKMIIRDGFATSKRPTAHARPVSVWRLVDRPAAERWLADHPEEVKPDPVPPAPVSIPTRQPSLPGLLEVSL